MILSCPSCGTRYTLLESQLGPAGRKVRCAACKTTWHAEAAPAPEDPIDLAPEPAPKPRVEDLRQIKAEKLPSRYRALLQDKKRLKALTAQGLVWGGMAAAFIAVFGLAFMLRVNIVSAFPRIAGAYAMVGLKVNATHLQFGNKSADAAFKGGQFVVTVQAQVKNLSDKPVPVPPVRVKLMDSTLQTFSSVLIPSSGLVVGPHQTRTLTFDVADPKNMTASIDLDFDLVAMKAMKNSPAPLRPAMAEADSPPASEDPASESATTELADNNTLPATAPVSAAAIDSDSGAPVSDHASPPLRPPLSDDGDGPSAHKAAH
ncbi:MJ0042-type zinc finger domain-containing protein [Asticcacaulis sp. EMRT-3]|uniref:MJ0042-type zinc finger domain-containing protein n=1 Tax=Asticcacaulis sp. EMRT-3 TaxID=3040349 RepID=UPI0024AF57AB|nr:MJ0042-type zinc finger domain-containing protein [Asticcacaulis sp. EMRT-3]MDI7776043.1 zinc-ribbon domain-containing protein [Asticcacaulis sp. EMRT-3]